MAEQIEIRNETAEPMLVSACRSKLSGRLYVHVGPCHEDREVYLGPYDYAIVDVKEIYV